MKSPRHIVSILVALTLAAMLSGCGTNSTPTGLDSLDQTAPAAPSQIVADTNVSTSSAALQWTPSASANAAGYEIYQYLPCPENESAYALVGETNAATTHYALPWAPVQTTLYYRLRTVSATGVKSAWSALVQATVGPQLGGGQDSEGVGIPIRR